ncbi:MAG: SDR family oxidoreductase [candidate division NC10 bacterium]|nr:SDR family oxidoreductase [candidate division NC10 bacterium]
MDLKDKVAIVTGGARGIGEAIAATLAREGATVVIGDLLEAEAGETVERIRQAGGTADFVRTDVSSRKEMEALAGAAIRQHGRVEILVNNAGALGIGKLLETTDELWDRMQAINLRSAFYGCQIVARHMVERKIQGKLVNISSQNGLIVRENEGAYSVAKAGVIALTRCLAVELAPHHINVNAIAPGVVRTNISKGLFPPEAYAARREAHLKAVPWGEIAEPQDIANVALFLASPLSRYVTGAVIVADGALTIDKTVIR